MNRDQKAAVVDEIAGQLQAAEAIFAVDYRGLSVSDAADLRAKLRDADTRLRIVKNSLSERAAEKAGTEALKPLLEGPTALALVHGDAALAAKALNDTARALNILEFKGGLMNGSALSADDIRSIARLPAREVLNAQLVGTIASPLTGLARTLNALLAGLAIQLKAMADEGLVSGEVPAAEPPPVEPEGEAEAEAPESEPAPVEPEGEAEAPAPESEPAPVEPEGEAEAEAPESEPAPAEPETPAEAEVPAPAEPEPSQPEPEVAESSAAPEPQATPEPEPEQSGQPEPEAEAASDAEPSDA